jgi:predicted Rossmann-fold nucleotide-binding protein
LETSIVIPEFVDARVAPRGALESLSQDEIEQLLSSGQGGLYPLFRRCALAVLNAGSDTDDARVIFDKYRDFDIRLLRHAFGVKLEIRNAPASAFVDGEMIRGIKELLFAVLRDVVYTANEIVDSGRFDLGKPQAVTNAVFHILRNARLLDHKLRPNVVVCWGGHSINREEYEYTKKVGYELGLRGLDVCTGCGPGAMKGPMKGATIGHAKQRIVTGRYIGLTEPGIIAAEPPNPIVNHLVIMPDIEKRLEAFVRIGHGIVVFPGGAGTAEEIFYLLGILLDPANAAQPFPVVLTGPKRSAAYFEQIRQFLIGTLGAQAADRLRVVIDDPAEVARIMDPRPSPVSESDEDDFSR